MGDFSQHASAFSCRLIVLVNLECHLCGYHGTPPSTRQHQRYGDCLKVKMEYYQNCSVLSCVTQCSQSAAEFLCTEVPDFIPPELWPPCSPDLNAVKYTIWGCMEKCLYKKSICDLAELKQWLVKVWADFKQTIVDRAIDQCRKWLQACVKA